MLLTGLAVFFTLTWFMSSSGGSSNYDPYAPSDFQYDGQKPQGKTPSAPVDFGSLSDVLTGGSIAPKLGNETAKYSTSFTHGETADGQFRAC